VEKRTALYLKSRKEYSDVVGRGVYRFGWKLEWSEEKRTEGNYLYFRYL
jgi:hypothetical protein